MFHPHMSFRILHTALKLGSDWKNATQAFVTADKWMLIADA